MRTSLPDALASGTPPESSATLRVAAATLARGFGVADPELTQILPNLAHFGAGANRADYPIDLGFIQESPLGALSVLLGCQRRICGHSKPSWIFSAQGHSAGPRRAGLPLKRVA